MKNEPWRPYHILEGDNLMPGPITCLSEYVNLTYTHTPTCVKQLKSPSLIGRLLKFLSRLNPISKEKRMSTKKKLRTKIKNLEYNVEIQKETIEGWEKAYGDYVKKYTALQQAICYLSEKAEIIQTEKDVFAPKPFSW